MTDLPISALPSFQTVPSCERNPRHEFDESVRRLLVGERRDIRSQSPPCRNGQNDRQHGQGRQRGMDAFALFLRPTVSCRDARPRHLLRDGPKRRRPRQGCLISHAIGGSMKSKAERPPTALSRPVHSGDRPSMPPAGKVPGKRSRNPQGKSERKTGGRLGQTRR